MTPYRTSLSARLITIGVALALFGGGAIPLFHLPVAALPMVLLFSVGLGLVGLLLGVNSHTNSALLLALLMPLALFAYVLALLMAINYVHELGWLMMGLGVAAVASIPVAQVTAPARTVEHKTANAH